MLNYIYGAVSTMSIMAVANILDSNMENSLQHWISHYMPF